MPVVKTGHFPAEISYQFPADRKVLWRKEELFKIVPVHRGEQSLSNTLRKVTHPA